MLHNFKKYKIQNPSATTWSEDLPVKTDQLKKKGRVKQKPTNVAICKGNQLVSKVVSFEHP